MIKNMAEEIPETVEKVSALCMELWNSHSVFSKEDLVPDHFRALKISARESNR